MGSTDLAPRAPLHSASDVMTLGQTLAKSGYFKDAQDAAKAVVKILYGQEVGIGPATAMSAIHVVEGKPTYSATLMAALIKRSGKYDYRVLRLDDDGCDLAFYQRDGGKWDEIGRSGFTTDDATAANLAGRQVWKSYRRNMLFARALSNGARWYTPDVFGGTPAYTPDELGAEVDGSTGELVNPPAPHALPSPPTIPAEIEADTERMAPSRRAAPAKWVQDYETLAGEALADYEIVAPSLPENADAETVARMGQELRKHIDAAKAAESV